MRGTYDQGMLPISMLGENAGVYAIAQFGRKVVEESLRLLNTRSADWWSVSRPVVCELRATQACGTRVDRAWRRWQSLLAAVLWCNDHLGGRVKIIDVSRS